jgi:uncharacterized protein YecE (DUF72 family)
MRKATSPANRSPSAFDYDYSPAEITGITERIGALAANAGAVHVALNNNRSNYAPKAALAIKAALGTAGLS